jgi:hypothetical protein
MRFPIANKENRTDFFCDKCRLFKFVDEMTAHRSPQNSPTNTYSATLWVNSFEACLSKKKKSASTKPRTNRLKYFDTKNNHHSRKEPDQRVLTLISMLCRSQIQRLPTDIARTCLSRNIEISLKDPLEAEIENTSKSRNCWVALNPVRCPFPLPCKSVNRVFRGSNKRSAGEREHTQGRGKHALHCGLPTTF